MKVNYVTFAVLLLLSKNVLAVAPTIPSSVDPARVGQQLGDPLTPPKKQATIIDEAKKRMRAKCQAQIKFDLI